GSERGDPGRARAGRGGALQEAQPRGPCAVLVDALAVLGTHDLLGAHRFPLRVVLFSIHPAASTKAGPLWITALAAGGEFALRRSPPMPDGSPTDLHPLVGGFTDAAGYDRARPRYDARVAAALVEQLGLADGAPVLELGAGT